MQKVLLILNGSAGKGRIKSKTYEIIEQICKEKCIVTVVTVSPENTLESNEIFQSDWKSFDKIVCAGGDGTLNRTINAILDKNLFNESVIGYIPSGSTNDFAKTVGIPKNFTKAINVAINGKVYKYDIGKFNDKHFNYVAAFGAFSAVSYTTNQSFKNVFGHAAYFLQVLNNFSENIKYKSYLKIKTDVFEEEGNYVFGAIHNATSVGGFNIGSKKNVMLNDGLFEILLIKAPQNFSELSKIAQSLLNGDFDNPFLSFHQIKYAEIISNEEVAWTLDGEFGGKSKTVRFDVKPSAIQIMIP